MHDHPFSRHDTTTSDGTLAIASLPPGAYMFSAGLVQSLGGGESRTIDGEITIAADHDTAVEVAFAAGTTVVIAAHPPAGVAFKGIKYWLFSKTAPATAAEARARAVSDHSPSMAHGAGLKNTSAQFHDVEPGTYAACAGLFDVRTMDAMDSPYGCTLLTVGDADSVTEIEVTLTK